MPTLNRLYFLSIPVEVLLNIRTGYESDAIFISQTACLFLVYTRHTLAFAAVLRRRCLRV